MTRSETGCATASPGPSPLDRIHGEEADTFTQVHSILRQVEVAGEAVQRQARDPRAISLEGGAESVLRGAAVGHSREGGLRHAQHQKGYAAHRVPRPAH